jgi:hypothetical protein
MKARRMSFASATISRRISLGGVTLVSAGGVRVSLTQAAELLGLESPESFVELPSAPASLAQARNDSVVRSDGYYSSRKGAEHLPGKTRRWMLNNAKKIAGSTKVGRDWVVSHAAYAQWLAAEDAASCRVEVASSPIHNTDAYMIAERTLANAGLRPTKGR